MKKALRGQMKKLPLVVLFLSAVPALATTRYVSPTGSDTNSCSTSTASGSPKQHLLGSGGALACMLGGDTLYLLSGTYTEGDIGIINTIPGGTSSAPTTIALAPGSVARSAIIQPTSSYTQVIELRGSTSQYIVFDGLVLDGINSTSGDVFKLTYTGPDTNGANHIQLSNGEVRNSFNQGIQVTVASSSDNKFINLEIHHNGRGKSINLLHGIYIQTANNLVDHCIIHDNFAWGITLYDGGVNQVNNNIIQKNTVYNNGSAGSGGGINPGSGSGNIITNNIVYGNQFAGIYLFGALNSKVYNNTVDGNSGDGFRTYQAGGSAVTNNLMSNNAQDMNIEGGSVPTFATNLCTAGSVTAPNCGSTSGIINSNPGFVNAAAHDYHLASSMSPAADHGTNLSPDLTDDFFGNARPFPAGGNYDIGMHEFTTATAPNTPPVEDFVYTAGTDLASRNGGTNWTGAWAAVSGTITTEVPPSGSLTAGNALRASSTSGQNSYQRQFTAVATGTIRWQMQSSVNNSGYRDVSLQDSTGANFVVLAMKDDGHFHACADYPGLDTDLGAYTANTWYFVKVEFDAASQATKYRVQLDQGTFSAWISQCQTTSASQVERFDVFDNTAVAHQFWVDSIGADATMLAFTTQPPSSVVISTPFSANVSLTYSNGSTIVPGRTDSITLTTCASSPPATLTAASGLTKAAVNGTASWTDLVLTVPSPPTSGIDLCATVMPMGITSGESTAITVNNGIPPVSSVSTVPRIRARTR